MTTPAIENTDIDLTALSLRNLRSVAAIGAAGSLTAAAAELGFSQATLSSHLAAAEAELGTTLFDRHGRGVVPTAAGRAVLGHIAAVFDALGALRDDARGAHRPTITIGAMETTAGSSAMPFIRRMERAHPGTKFALRIAAPTELRALVERGDIDIAITAVVRGSSRTSTFQPLFDQDLVLLVPAGHRLAGAKRADLRALAGEQLIVGDDACQYRNIVEGLLHEADIDVALRARFGSIGTLPQAVASGLGIAILPRESVSPKPGKTAIVPLRVPIHVTVGVLARRDASPAVNGIIGELVTQQKRPATR